MIHKQRVVGNQGEHQLLSPCGATVRGSFPVWPLSKFPATVRGNSTLRGYCSVSTPHAGPLSEDTVSGGFEATVRAKGNPAPPVGNSGQQGGAGVTTPPGRRVMTMPGGVCPGFSAERYRARTSRRVRCGHSESGRNRRLLRRRAYAARSVAWGRGARIPQCRG